MALFIDKLAVTSPTIPALHRIPDEHAADGGNTAPTLIVSGAPEGTVEFAVICHDPDAPLPQGFTHWTVYGVPGDASVIDVTTTSVRVGPNGIGGAAWTGPQPPVGHGLHHYYFWLYALGRTVAGEPTREEFLKEYADAIIEQARLVGTYER
jgi:Raf kinase inhibitor-like YbhB/YbcL family protein